MDRAKRLKSAAALNLWSKGSRRVRGRRRDRSEEEAKCFFGNEAPASIRPDLVVEVPYVNHPKVSGLVDRLKPDIMPYSGPVTSAARRSRGGRLGIINLHGGLSPPYRGSDCTFWALYNGQPDQVGCTLHFIYPGIDTSNLIAHICSEVSEGDDESTIFWRGVRNSAEIYAQCLDRFGRGETMGQRQSEKGRLRLFQAQDLAA